ncbi:hypothetical protein LSTR_LSTR004844 [Laodelphax striatellus]|uniref:Uncharacterized protein n=1 Tax=Laodelphax striatellus TaxID=195883 RepID=A0A482WI79_LAOST|nr:hypothetical protein LSTR_LSTR004844 [Laodelphax striatellus]
MDETEESQDLLSDASLNSQEIDNWMQDLQTHIPAAQISLNHSTPTHHEQLHGDSMAEEGSNIFEEISIIEEADIENYNACILEVADIETEHSYSISPHKIEQYPSTSVRPDESPPPNGQIRYEEPEDKDPEFIPESEECTSTLNRDTRGGKVEEDKTREYTTVKDKTEEDNAGEDKTEEDNAGEDETDEDKAEDGRIIVDEMIEVYEMIGVDEMI